MKQLSWFTVKKVHPRVVAIAEFNHFEKVVSYLVLGDKKAVLIDTGMGYEDMRSVVSKLTPLPISVLLTHAHWDHIGGINAFDEVSLFHDPFEQLLLKAGFNSSSIPELIDKAMFAGIFVPHAYRVNGKMSSNLLYPAQRIVLTPFTIEVIHTPGHTPGSICFYIPEMRALFTGDTIYPGPLYAYLPESNMKDYMHSIEKLHAQASKVDFVFPGHNAMISKSVLIQSAYDLFQNRNHIKALRTELDGVVRYKGQGLSLLVKDKIRKSKQGANA